jgi:hypothetical protein
MRRSSAVQEAVDEFRSTITGRYAPLFEGRQVAILKLSD